MKKTPFRNFHFVLPIAGVIAPFSVGAHKVLLNLNDVVGPTATRDAARLSHEQSSHLDSHQGIVDELFIDDPGSTFSLMQQFAHTKNAARTTGQIPIEGCSSCQGFIDYPWLMKKLDRPRLFILLLVLWTCVLIWLLNTTAQDFFVPPLVYWSRLLRLRPEVAGATLVAFGNGAPDVFAMGTATSSADLPLALTELLGANMFVLCISGGAVVLISHYKRLSATSAFETTQVGLPASKYEEEANTTQQIGNYAESISSYAATLVYVFVLLCHGQITVLNTMSLPVIYLVYLAVLIPKRSTGASLQPEDPNECDSHGESLAGLAPPEHASWIEYLGWALAWPTYAIRWVLIPPADLQWDRVRRTVSSLAPIGLLFLAAALDPNGFPQLHLAARLCMTLLAACTSAAIYYYSGDGPDIPKFYPCLTLLSKVSSIIVLKLIADELTAVVESTGWMYNIPRLWLASTAVSWGNSVGDLVTGIAMVKKGQTRMAFTSIFAGPLFNCTVGGGIALMFAASNNGGVVSLGSTDIGRLVLLLNVCFLGLALILLSFVFIAWQRSLMCWPYLLFSVYAIFLATVLFLEQRDVDVNSHLA